MIRVPNDRFLNGIHKWQREILRDFDDKVARFFLINWHRRARKCRAYNTHIQLSDGSYHKVQELIDKSFRVLSVNKNGDYKICDAVAEDNGLHECFEVITESGRTVTATGNHPLLTFFGWKDILDLNAGEKILIPKSVPIHGKETINKDELKFIAYMIGDGSVSSGNCRFSQEDNHQLKEFKKVVESLGGTCKRVNKYDYSICGMRDVLKKYGVWGKTSHNKTIPDKIFKLTDAQIGIFLSRLFSTDGWFNKRKQIGYCSVNRVMLEQIQLLLLRFGIFSTITNKTSKGFLSNQLNICSAEDVYRFGCEIGIYGKLDRKMLPVLFPNTKGYKYKSKIQRYSHMNNNFIYDSIKSIKSVGMCKTVAIDVPESQNYVHAVVEHNTTLGVNALIKESVRNSSSRYGYITSTYKAAKNIVWRDPNMLKAYLPDGAHKKPNESELYVEFNNKSILSIHGSDDPDSIRGVDFKGVVIDEYALCKPQVWEEIIRPIMAQDKDRWAMFLFTPKGKNHAFQQILKTKDNPEWKYYCLKSSESGIISREEVEKARQELPERVFMQELECEFNDDASSLFRGITNCIAGGFENKIVGRSYITGVDLAKYQDYTVIITICRETKQVVSFQRFNQIDWNLQKEKIIAECVKYNSQLCIDATGVGDPIVDDLRRSGITVPEQGIIKLTNESKKQIIDRLIVAIEQRLITFPRIPEMIDELAAFSCELTAAGNIRYGAPEGIHDDCVIALSLAVHGLRNFLYSDMSRSTRPRQTLITGGAY